MNPITNAKNILKLNQRELDLGVTGKNKKSWHDEYKDSAWVFIGGLPYDLTEGDVVCVFSQYGEVVNVNLVRDKSTGKSKGYAFLCYEDQRSTVLAVDNLNTIKVLGRIIRVDHVADYKKPKEKGDEDEVTLMLRAEGCAPKVPQTSTTPPPLPPQSELPSLGGPPLTIRPLPGAVKPKKAKKDKKKKKKKKKKMKVTVKVERRSDSDSSSSSGESSDDDNDDVDDDDDRPRRKRKSPVNLLHADELKREKEDRGYDRALHGHHHTTSPSRRNRESRDMKPEISHLEESRHRSGDRYRESTEGQREKLTVKREPSESQRHRDDKRSDRREEERRHRDRDEDRDRQDDRRRDDRRDYRRDRDDYDRRRR
ncbi:hypothetical protein ACOMHN_014630 [Nucella lapillus]